MKLKGEFCRVRMDQYWYICALQTETLNPTFCQNVIFFHQNVDGNIKFRHSSIIIDHQIDKKHQILTKNEVERRMP